VSVDIGVAKLSFLLPVGWRIDNGMDASQDKLDKSGCSF